MKECLPSKGKVETSMYDSYIEVLIKKKTPLSYKITELVLVILTMGLFLSFFLLKSILLPIIGVIMCVVDYYVFLSLNLEFEYLYVNGGLQVDKIMNKQKRKQYLDINMEKVEVVAPKESSHLDGYRNQKVVIKDCTSGNDKECYVLICRSGSELWEVRIEPNVKMLEAMRLTAPRKVFLE